MEIHFTIFFSQLFITLSPPVSQPRAYFKSLTLSDFFNHYVGMCAVVFISRLKERCSFKEILFHVSFLTFTSNFPRCTSNHSTTIKNTQVYSIIEIGRRALCFDGLSLWASPLLADGFAPTLNLDWYTFFSKSCLYTFSNTENNVQSRFRLFPIDDFCSLSMTKCYDGVAQKTVFLLCF